MRTSAHRSAVRVEPSARWTNRARRQARVRPPVLQREVPLASDQLHTQLVQLETHTAPAVDELGQQLDHVRFGELRVPEGGESFTKAFWRDFGQRNPRFVRKQFNTTWCSPIAANHTQIGLSRLCGTERRAAAHVVRGRPGNREKWAPEMAAAAHSSNVKFASLDRFDFGKHGSALAG